MTILSTTTDNVYVCCNAGADLCRDVSEYLVRTQTTLHMSPPIPIGFQVGSMTAGRH